jgi:predicted AAA+ superfamily ATPase
MYKKLASKLMRRETPRYLEGPVRADLARKMVFVAGPRQVGKTTLARRLVGRGTGYLSWDIPEHRAKILARRLPAAPLWAFDELHKYRSWRALLKGLYDAKAANRSILVTGSAKLDFYRYGGDSLQGRYLAYRMHPLSVAELGIETKADFEALLRLGGFPEPFFGGNEREARRWSQAYRTLLIRDELTDLERIQDLGNLELLAMRLPELVGSPLSINALREDLQLNHRTVARWLDALERLYALFRLPPFGAPRLRAVKKERKHYHFDWTLVPEAPQRFENFIAAQLLKWVHYQADHEGRPLELRYFRDVDRREVDFVVVEGRKPVLMVECKLSETAVDPGLRYLKARFPACPAFQISAKGTTDYETPEGIRVTPALTLLREWV